MSLNERKAGILLPMFSLPSKYGIGSFGKDSFKFVDFLEKTGQTYWQLLPMNQLNDTYSPYQATSGFAGNYFFIDLEKLVEEGYLSKYQIKIALEDRKRYYHKVDYKKIEKTRNILLRKAYKKFDQLVNLEDFNQFLEKNSYWVYDYARFQTIKEKVELIDGVEYKMNHMAWSKWPLKYRQIENKEQFDKENEHEFKYWLFVQYLFYKQWAELKKYANDKGIKFVGDIPIYVGYDSADVWAHPELFKLDRETFDIAYQAGCPADAFSDTGQLWGNPVYDWQEHEKDNYNWWFEKMKNQSDLFDVVRIDHFKGFESYFQIPKDKLPTDQGSSWQIGPRERLFDSIMPRVKGLEIIVEDLGYITQDTINLLKHLGYPGMFIVQTSVDYDRYVRSVHDADTNMVVYLGTHDHGTTKSWYDNSNDTFKQTIQDLFQRENLNKGPVVDRLIQYTLSGKPNTCIIVLQDYLRKDDKARINRPGTVLDNWIYKFTEKEIYENSSLEKRVYQYTKQANRLR